MLIGKLTPTHTFVRRHAVVWPTIMSAIEYAKQLTGVAWLLAELDVGFDVDDCCVDCTM